MARNLATWPTSASCLAVICAILLTLPGGLHAGEINANSDSVAIRGYDPVAYFTFNEAVPGSEEHAHTWLGATWLFANEEHRRAFTEEPTRFAPQYGGYCTLGVSFGRKVTDIDPEAWQIVDGKLYLNYSPDDQGSPEELIARADANWEKHKKYFTGE